MPGGGKSKENPKGGKPAEPKKDPVKDKAKVDNKTKGKGKK